MAKLNKHLAKNVFYNTFNKFMLEKHKDVMSNNYNVELFKYYSLILHDPREIYNLLVDKRFKIYHDDLFAFNILLNLFNITFNCRSSEMINYSLSLNDFDFNKFITPLQYFSYTLEFFEDYKRSKINNSTFVENTFSTTINNNLLLSIENIIIIHNGYNPKHSYNKALYCKIKELIEEKFPSNSNLYHLLNNFIKSIRKKNFYEDYEFYLNNYFDNLNHLKGTPYFIHSTLLYIHESTVSLQYNQRIPNPYHYYKLRISQYLSFMIENITEITPNSNYNYVEVICRKIEFFIRSISSDERIYKTIIFNTINNHLKCRKGLLALYNLINEDGKIDTFKNFREALREYFEKNKNIPEIRGVINLSKLI